MHTEKHEKAGQTVRVELKGPIATGLESGLTVIEEFRIEDWWDQMNGVSWMYSDGNFAAMSYAMRSGFGGLPLDDEVVYGKNVASGIGHIVHVSELV